MKNGDKEVSVEGINTSLMSIKATCAFIDNSSVTIIEDPPEKS